MKSEQKICIAFLLNLIFSGIEFAGGILTGSYAILSDALHDFGDSISIGISFLLERISKKKPDKSHTYGYARYSVLGSVITTVILLFGSVTIFYHAIPRILHPVPVHYNGMLLLAALGVIMNVAAAYFTHGKGSLNQKAVNLHMLEDVFGWAACFVGAVLMKWTGLSVIDPILSIGASALIAVGAVRNLKRVLDIFLEKTPAEIDVDALRAHILEIDGILDVHHIHVRTTDGFSHYLTLHAVTDGEAVEMKGKIKEKMKAEGISHTTVEIEKSGECCAEITCDIQKNEGHHHGHYHHHHHE